MKLKTIASIFNRNKRLIIFTAPNGEQWIGNGIAAYSLREMPYLTPEIVLRIFDIPADKHCKWFCEESDLPKMINFEDNTDTEINIEPLRTSVGWDGVKYLLFPDGQKIYSFNEDYIKPLLDEPDYLAFFKRETPTGKFFLACKVGLELKAIIAPAILKEKFTKEINRIATLYSAMEGKRDEDESENYDLQENDQSIEIDVDTGEVIDGQLEFQDEES